MHKFSDFADEKQLAGEKVKIAEILGKEIAVTDYRISTSKYKDHPDRKQCLTLQFTMDEKAYVLFTGSEVLIKQIEKYKEQIPFLATVQRINNFYSFT